MTTNTDANNNNNDPTASTTTSNNTLINKTITIHSLTSRPDLNGRLGIVIEHYEDRDRYGVIPYHSKIIPSNGRTFDRPSAAAAAARSRQQHTSSTSTQQPQAPLSLRASNVRPATPKDRTMATIEYAKYTSVDLLRTIQSDPSIHIIQRRIESSFPPAFVSAIPNGMSPMTVLGMLVLILSYLLYRFVFDSNLSKVLLLFSMIMILTMVCLPDLASSNIPLVNVMKNIPNRWREFISRVIYHRGDEYGAAAVGGGGGKMVGMITSNATLFVFVVLVGGLLIMKTPTSAPTSSFEPPRAPYTGEHRQEQQRQNWVMEDIYKLGYNDGTNGDEYGKSLPDTSSIMSSVVDSKSTAEGLYKDDGDEPMYGSNNDHKYDNAGYDNHHNSYVPPPPPQKSKFGISSIMSLFALGNTVKELGFIPSGGTAEGGSGFGGFMGGRKFDGPTLIRNLKMLPPWRKGMIGMCLYRIVTSVL